MLGSECIWSDLISSYLIKSGLYRLCYGLIGCCLIRPLLPLCSPIGPYPLHSYLIKSDLLIHCLPRMWTSLLWCALISISPVWSDPLSCTSRCDTEMRCYSSERHIRDGLLSVGPAGRWQQYLRDIMRIKETACSVWRPLLLATYFTSREPKQVQWPWTVAPWVTVSLSSSLLHWASGLGDSRR